MKCYLFLLLFIMSAVSLQAQITPTAPLKTGIQTRLPSETLDVNGTACVMNLPLLGGLIYNGEPTNNTPYQPASLVVANENGVLGTAPFVETDDVNNWIYFPPIHLPTNSSEVSEITRSSSIVLTNYYDPSHFRVRLPLWMRSQLLAPQLAESNAISVKSPSASTDIGYANYVGVDMRTSQNCFYYITYYDPDVFTEVSINYEAELSYKVKPNAVVTSKTYMTIVAHIPLREG